MNNRMILSGLVAITALATPMMASATTAAPKTTVAKHHKAKAGKAARGTRITKKTETTTMTSPASKK